MEDKIHPRWVRRAKVINRYQTSDRTIERWIKVGAFPAPKVIGVNTHRFDENELDEYDANPEGWKARNKKPGEAAA